MTHNNLIRDLVYAGHEKEPKPEAKHTTIEFSGGHLGFIEFFSALPDVADVLSTAVIFFPTVLLALQGIRG
jgi:hypothetical protein